MSTLDGCGRIASLGSAFRLCTHIARMRLQKLLSSRITRLWKRSAQPNGKKINGRDHQCLQALKPNGSTAHRATRSCSPGPKLEILEELEEVFRHFDADGDGKICVSELGAVLRSLGDKLTSEEELQTMIREVDCDGDGCIDLQEFIRFNTQSQGGGVGSLEELRDAFRVFDIDRNGYISAEELQSVLESLGDKCSLEDCFHMIRGVDSDGDGFVDFEEFRKMMTSSFHGYRF